MQNPVRRLQSVRLLHAMTLALTYDNGEVVHVDFSELPQRFAVFADLQDPNVFAQARVVDWGHVLEWPGGEGLDAERILEMAAEQANGTAT